jgi:16S rRNA (guanine1207-N2)-methyltransferase
MEHYSTTDPQSELIVTEIDYELINPIRNIKLSLKIPSGVFASKYIDKATDLLIKSSINYFHENNFDIENKKVLDLGCGYGIISLVYASLNANVTGSDINKRALKFARINTKGNRLKLELINSDFFTNINDKFDLIITNPPFKVGREKLKKMLEEIKEHLNEKGMFIFVAPYNQGGKYLAQFTEELFGNKTILKRKSGFRVWVFKK